MKLVETEGKINQAVVNFLKHYHFRSSHLRCYVKNVFLEISQNSQENTSARDSFLIKLQARGQQLYCNFIKIESLTQVFSCGFCEIFNNTLFYRNLWWLLLTATTFLLQHIFYHYLKKLHESFKDAWLLWLKPF